MDRAFESLAKQKEEVSLANTGIAYLSFLLTIEIPIPPRKSVDMLSRLIDISQAKGDLEDMFQSLLDKSKMNMLSAGLSPAQMLFTFETARLTGLDDLKELLEALNDLTPEKRAYLLVSLVASGRHRCRFVSKYCLVKRRFKKSA